MGQRKRQLKAQIQELERINFQLLNENEFLKDAKIKPYIESDKGKMVVCQKDIATIEHLQDLWLDIKPFLNDESETVERSKVLIRKMYDIVDSKNK